MSVSDDVVNLNEIYQVEAKDLAKEILYIYKYKYLYIFDVIRGIYYFNVVVLSLYNVSFSLSPLAFFVRFFLEEKYDFVHVNVDVPRQVNIQSPL